MKKLSIDMLNAYPTLSPEELMEIKGGVIPWAAIAAGAGIVAGGYALYCWVKDVYNDWIKDHPEERQKITFNDFAIDVIEKWKNNGSFSMSIDSIGSNGTVYGFKFYGQKSQGCNCSH